MKKRIGTFLKSFSGDRWLIGLSILNILVAGLVIIAIAIAIQPRETQVITQYSAFGLTNFYQNYWQTLWLYVVLEIFIVLGNILLAGKLVSVNNRQLALALLWLTVGLSFLVLLFAWPILKIAALG